MRSRGLVEGGARACALRVAVRCDVRVEAGARGLAAGRARASCVTGLRIFHITGQEATSTEMTACEMASGREQERRSGVNGCATPSGAPRQESCGDAPHSALEHAHCTTGVTLIPRSMAQRSLARCRGRQAGAAREGNSCGCWRETLLGAPRWAWSVVCIACWCYVRNALRSLCIC